MVVADPVQAVEVCIQSMAWDSNWEEDFLYSAERRIEEGHPLDEKQIRIIERIFHRIPEEVLQ